MKRHVGKLQMERAVNGKSRLNTRALSATASLRITLLALMCPLATGLHAATIMAGNLWRTR